MIVLRASLHIVSEQRETFLAHVQGFVEDSRAESGCISFDVCQDVLNPDHFLVIEVWQDHAALQSHEESAHLARFKAAIADAIVHKDPTQVYAIHDVSTL